MFIIMIRSVIIYVVILLLFRVMGKRQLGQMQPFELVLTLIIADLATMPLSEISTPIMMGFVPVFTLVLFHFLLTFFSGKSIKFGRFISGRPVVVITPQGIVQKALKELCLSIDDLTECMRSSGFFAFDEIQYAIMETNGKISFMPKQGVENNQELSISLICDGEEIKENLKRLDKTEEDLKVLIKTINTKLKPKDFLVLTLDKNGKVFYQVKGQESCVLFDKVEA